jgi:hypothetical protein
VSGRPAVSVIVPFTGFDADLRACVARLATLVVRAGDEVLVADNRPGAGGAGGGHGVRIVAADGVRAAGFARNRAAEVAHGEWLVLIDADTRPVPDRSGEEADLCFRLARAGWTLEERPATLVEHPTRPTLGALLTQVAHHGSGAAWLNRHYPGEFPAPGPRGFAGTVAHAGAAAVRGARRGDRDAVNAGVIEMC